MCALGLILTMKAHSANAQDNEGGAASDVSLEMDTGSSKSEESTAEPSEDNAEGSAASQTPKPVKLCVIMYHGLVKGSAKQNRYMIDPHFFEDDLRYLTENGYTAISAKELVGHFISGMPLPDKPVMLTFDDGYYNNYLYAFPLLKKYGCKAVLSPIGKACENAENEERQNEFYSQCTISQLREMYESGLVEIAYHTYDLHSLESGVQGVQKRPDESDDAYKNRLAQDIRCFRESMQSADGGELYCFTYPFGAKSRLTGDIVRSEGFLCALDCEEKVNILGSAEDLYSIHRFLRDGKTSSDEFFRNISLSGA